MHKINWLVLDHGRRLNFLMFNAFVIGFPEGGGGGGPRADVGTLLIVHFKVLVFPHRWGFFFWQSPQYLAKPNTQQDEKTHFRTSVLFFEQLAQDIMIKT